MPIGYLLARKKFFGKALVESVLDIPIVLPPMVIGLCLQFESMMGEADLADGVRMRVWSRRVSPRGGFRYVVVQLD